MKLEAFTIVESMMAMVIIMISFTAGMNIYLTVLQGDAFPLKTKAKNALNIAYEITKNEQRFLDENFNQNGLMIEKKVLPYEAYQGILKQENIYQVSLKAYSPDEQLVAVQEHLIRVTYEN
jgi:hypothetical protein